MLAKRQQRRFPASLSAGLFGILWLAGCSPASEGESSLPEPSRPEYVGAAVCGDCHEAEVTQWQGSHHELAMQPATEDSVVGNFEDAVFSHAGETTRFFRRDEGFFVSTTDVDGEQGEFEVTHAFGIEPLQQYLVQLDAGRMQALSVAWDSRPAAAGGGQWFHLYPDDTPDASDPLHWTGVYQNWNTMCADCHSTDLQKNYDPVADSYQTSWSDINVACEACHGPGSVHAADPTRLLPASGAVDRTWVFDTGNPIARRVPAADVAEHGGISAELNACASCHSRRAQLTDAHDPGADFFDAFRLSLLDPGLYHDDGQIREEVYVLGSFLQSRMAAAGVSCSDCHDPHSAELRFDGNTLCAQCHLASEYDQPEHHRHQPATAGAECTACHMRAETFMQVDPRRDHSFRVPRPDLSVDLGVPNACTDCHAEEGAEWAASRIEEWNPGARRPHFGEVLNAARNWSADARSRLVALINDNSAPAIARATAVGSLAERMTLGDVEVLAGLLDSGDAMLQLAAIEAAEVLPADRRAELVQRFLSHELLSHRIAAGQVLLSAAEQLSERRRDDLAHAIDEFLEAQRFNSDRAEGLLGRADVLAAQGRFDEAEQLYREALRRHPESVPAYANLADLFRQTGREADSEQLLRDALVVAPDDFRVHRALGFALVRTGRADEALTHFEEAARLAPEEPYNGYLLAIAINDSGEQARALAALELTHDRFPGHPQTLFALATMHRDNGDVETARRYAEQYLEVMPGDDAGARLLSLLNQPL